MDKDDWFQRHVNTNVYVHISLSLYNGNRLSNAYQSGVRSLQYLSLTRPDIAFTINKLSQFMHKYPDVHWNAIKRLLQYLKGMLLRRHSPLTLHAFSDAGRAGNKNKRTSPATYVVFLGANLISWASKKQTLHQSP